MNLFKEHVSLNDNGTKIICAYATGTEVAPYSAIYLNVSHHLNDRYNLIVAVIASWSIAFILVIITCILLCACVLCRSICRRPRLKSMEHVAYSLDAYTILDLSADHDDVYSLNLHESPDEFLDSIQPPVLMHIQYESEEKRDNEQLESSSENGAAPEHKLPEPELPEHISSRDDDK